LRVREIVEKLELTVLAAGNLDQEVRWGFCSDLLSDVLGHASEGDIWITHQRHLNVVAVAKLKGIAAIVCVRNLRPSPEVLAKADGQGVTVLLSSEDAFEVAGRLYGLLSP